MRGFRFSLRWLLCVVSFMAVACGALVYASPFLSKLVFTAAIVLFLAAGAMAACCRGDARAHWVGFAAFGIVYLWLVCGTWHGPDGGGALRERLVTTDILIRCQDALPSRQPAGGSSPAGSPAAVAYSGAVFYDVSGIVGSSGYSPGYQAPSFLVPAATTSVERSDFLTTGHALSAVLFALLGGIVAKWIYCRSPAMPAG